MKNIVYKRKLVDIRGFDDKSINNTIIHVEKISEGQSLKIPFSFGEFSMHEEFARSVINIQSSLEDFDPQIPFVEKEEETMLSSYHCKSVFIILFVSLTFLSTGLMAQSVTFTDIAGSEGGVLFERVPSAQHSDAIAKYQASQTTPITFPDLLNFPTRTRGLPGVAIEDFDGDGDLDLYVTNGPGAPNSLFSSQLVESGTLSFISVAATAGVEATAQDSTGVCAGDIDNDGDADLLVLANTGPHNLFENQGDGTFTDISQSAGLNMNGVSATSCAMGDINNDSYLDIAIARTFPYSSLVPIFAEPVALNQPNELYLNLGQNTFADVSNSSGIRENANLPLGAAGISWAVAFVDYDLDGDVDLFFADDQGGIPPTVAGGLDRGFVQVFQNDGSGSFDAVGDELGTADRGESWMGLSYGDFNADGQLDFFGSNFGDYFLPLLMPQVPYVLGSQSSRWWLGNLQGGFDDPGVGSLVATPFGWGTSAEDFDNDGDTDIVFHGGLDMHVLNTKCNPGVLLLNDGAANFTADIGAFTTSHSRRNVQGVAAGDLNGDGFIDIVSVSNQDFPVPIPLVPYATAGIQYGSPFDADSAFIPGFVEVSPGAFSWTGVNYPNGGLSIELNNGETGYHSITVEPVGSAMLTPAGRVNRSGIGAVITVKPSHMPVATKPVLGGGSYLSQDSRAQTFGLRNETRAKVDILWPGGVKNRLYGAPADTKIVFPEIPCSFDDDTVNFFEYVACVRSSLSDLHRAGIINHSEVLHFKASAIFAWIEGR